MGSEMCIRDRFQSTHVNTSCQDCNVGITIAARYSSHNTLTIRRRLNVLRAGCESSSYMHPFRQSLPNSIGGRASHLYEVCRLDPRELVAVSKGKRKSLHVIQPRAHAVNHVFEAQVLIAVQQLDRPQLLRTHLPRMLHHLDSFDDLVRM